MLHKSLCLTHDCCWDVGGGGITLSLSSRSRQTGRTWGRDEISLKRQITNQFVSLSIVQGEDPLRQDWRKSGSGEAVMWCWPGHPVKVKNLDSGGFSFKPSVYFHATNQSFASLLAVYLKRKSCHVFHLTPSITTSASLLAVPPPRRHRTLPVGLVTIPLTMLHPL